MSEPALRFADHFSGHALSYAVHRPRYPAALYDWLATAAGGAELAWDVGTGNGQVAQGLATRFARVVATDPSEEQLSHAVPHARIRYQRTTYQPDLPDASVDLVAVGQALHWFALEEFFGSVRRLLKPGGLFAAFAYAHSRVSPEIDALMRQYHDVTVGPFWAPEHHWIHAGYRTLDLPIAEIDAPPFEIVERWSCAQYLGFLRTWSSVQRLMRAEGDAKVLAFEAELMEAWGRQSERAVVWPLILRAGRLP